MQVETAVGEVGNSEARPEKKRESREMGHRSRADNDVSARTSQRRPRDNGAAFPAALDADLAGRAARADCTILITGATGVGKGNLAKWLHLNSGRADGPFVPVNCAAIPETIIDSQLFGHARGAFSGATADHPGLVRAAENGTLLLDEVSELPPSAQSRLLRLLQEREVQPVGYPGPVVVDVRVIAATNIDLDEAVADRRFREDLLFRLDVIRLHVKLLRERLDELPDLVAAFNAEFSRLYRQPELKFDHEAIAMLKRCSWPGNVRQLRTVIERLFVLCPGEYVTPSLLLSVGQLDEALVNGRDSQSLQQVKLDHVRKVLAEAGGSVSRTASIFGVHRSTIYRWLRSD